MATIPNTAIKVFRDIQALRQWRRKQLLDHRSVGLVPTMGALHAGHLSLIRMAAAESSSVVVSIYVNPTQFGVHEDLDSYPQTWDADCRALRDLDRELAADGGNLGGIAAVFAPSTADMYPSGRPDQAVNAQGSFVNIIPLGQVLEGQSRPTFFRGVATVCMKLFNIVAPDHVYFGQKDIQQTVVVKKMVRDFHLDTAVVVGSTQREPDGLALSSRNVYLGARRRKIATVLHKALRLAEAEYTAGHRSRAQILGPGEAYAQDVLLKQQSMDPDQRVLFETDYLSLAHPDTMEELQEVDDAVGAIISGAIRMLPVEARRENEDMGFMDGPSVRLIDNIVIKKSA